VGAGAAPELECGRSLVLIPGPGADLQCTKPCGAGTRTRLVVCQRPNGERFTDLSCEILDKPPDREQCNVQDCPRDAAWSAGPWSSVRP